MYDYELDEDLFRVFSFSRNIYDNVFFKYETNIFYVPLSIFWYYTY